ncbi:MAG: HD domain-containing protein [Firmicutes bacterium]|nr:HD domain-containing protein [Bacillota bacterium]
MVSIETAIADYVNTMLCKKEFRKVRASKMIHDTIHGSNLFYAHEISILDLPLLQRLRYINQVDLVPLVFPSANHDRFEHTLGVTVVADKLLKALQSKDSNLVTQADIYNVRMAAILHDCGHGPFSHMSECIYRYCLDMVKTQENRKFHDRSPHEVLSHLIVRSEPFREFIENLINPTYNIRLDVNLISDMIVGWIDIPDKGYLVDIISGPFDADKLDYIQRDSHFTGIKLVLDLDRLFYTVCTVKDTKDRSRLSVDSTGVSTLEQIVFSKMMLYSTVYHHHKVRAAECVFKSIIHNISTEKLKVNDFDFSRSTDFLYFTDYDIYALDRLSQRIRNKLEMLRYRFLYKRALVISKKTIRHECLNRFYEITKLYEKPDQLDLLREAIYEKAKEKCDCSIDDIWIDIPKPPSFKEGADCLIKIAGTPDNVRLREVFPIDEWTTAFTQNKYQGFVFSPNSIREQVHEAAKAVIEDAFGIKFNDYAKILCKMADNGE